MILTVTAALSAAVIVAIVAFLIVRDSTPRVSRTGTLSVAASSTAPAATIPTASTVVPAAAVVSPTAITVPAIGITAPVEPVGVQPGTNQIEVPPLDHVGWYQLGAVPGGPGSAVLLGHVDGNGREGVFFRLGSLTPGDSLQLRFADGTTRAFHVVGRAEYPKAALPADLFSRAGPSRLVLITCGGSFDAAIHHYRDNVVVVATPDV